MKIIGKAKTNLEIYFQVEELKLYTLGCPKSIFLPQICFLQQWNQVCETSRCLSQQNEIDFASIISS